MHNAVFGGFKEDLWKNYTRSERSALSHTHTQNRFWPLHVRRLWSAIKKLLAELMRSV